MAQSTTEFVERTDADQAPPGPARISGGHLVAKALKAEGVDTTSASNFPLSASSATTHR